jgi:hypothetical protein
MTHHLKPQKPVFLKLLNQGLNESYIGVSGGRFNQKGEIGQNSDGEGLIKEEHPC